LQIEAAITLLHRAMRKFWSECKQLITEGSEKDASVLVRLMDKNMTKVPEACPVQRLYGIDAHNLTEETWNATINFLTS
jgi:hypothetical protein